MIVIVLLTLANLVSDYKQCDVNMKIVMLCGVEVKSEQMSLESFVENGELFCWHSVGSSFHHWGAKTEKCGNFAERALFARSDGGTSRPADVEEQSALAGVCGLTSVWR